MSGGGNNHPKLTDRGAGGEKEKKGQNYGQVGCLNRGGKFKSLWEDKRGMKELLGWRLTAKTLKKTSPGRPRTKRRKKGKTSGTKCGAKKT